MFMRLADIMTDLCAEFDGELLTCRAEGLELAVGLKAAEGQLLLMLKELAVLKVRIQPACQGAQWLLAAVGCRSSCSSGC
jgi:hypothetical protein